MRRYLARPVGIVLGTLVVLTLAGAGARADLVTNGNFSSPVLGSGGFIDVLAGQNTIPGWTIGGTDVLLIQTAYTEPGITFNAAPGATNSLDITGAANTGANTISQALATTVGQTYLLTFLLGNAYSTTNGSYQGTASVRVTLGNVVVNQLFSNAAQTPGAVNWQSQSLVFTANSANTLLTFTNATPVGTSYAGLNGVSVNTSAIPEPGTLALAAIGLPMFVGASILRRRRSA